MSLLLTRRSALGCLVALGSGCASALRSGAVAEQALLKPIPPPCNAIDIEVFFVDRDVHDPVTKTALWSQLNQMSAVDGDVQKRLDRDGFLYGIAPSTPPYSLQSLLNLTSQESPRYRTVRQVFQRPSGSDLELVTAQYPDETRFVLDGEPREFQNARCVLRLKVERLQERWAGLEFLPEIHHGAVSMRPAADEHNWTFAQSQEIDALYDHRFRMELNAGEFAVVGSRPNKPSVAQQFFAGNTVPGVQRLCVIRVNDTRQVSPQRSTQQS